MRQLYDYPHRIWHKRLNTTQKVIRTKVINNYKYNYSLNSACHPIETESVRSALDAFRIYARDDVEEVDSIVFVL